jgi:hypothetical protein
MNSISSTPQYNLPEEQVLNITNLLFQFLVWTVACVLNSACVSLRSSNQNSGIKYSAHEQMVFSR